MIDLNKPKADAFDLGAFIIEAVGVLREHGLDVDPTSLDTSGELVRCPVDGKPGGKDGAYVVHLDPPQTVICWNHVMGGETVTHQSGHIKSLSPEDRAAIRAGGRAREKRSQTWNRRKAANKA
jgi:putative DNA primase/helicase